MSEELVTDHCKWAVDIALLLFLTGLIIGLILGVICE
jgi:hypothetical protein